MKILFISLIFSAIASVSSAQTSLPYYEEYQCTTSEYNIRMIYSVGYDLHALTLFIGTNTLATGAKDLVDVRTLRIKKELPKALLFADSPKGQAPMKVEVPKSFASSEFERPKTFSMRINRKDAACEKH